jgi:hypothetical protein
MCSFDCSLPLLNACCAVGRQVPLLPVLCDAPVEMALEWGFERYGPWATHAHGDPHVTSADKKKD